MMHFLLSQPSHSATIAAQRTNEIQGLTQKNVGDFSEKVQRFSKNVGDFFENDGHFLTTLGHFMPHLSIF